MNSYKCHICGKEYKTAIEAANCTIADNRKNKLMELQKEEELRLSKLKKIKEGISSTYNDLYQQCKAYNELSKEDRLVLRIDVIDKQNTVDNSVSLLDLLQHWF